MIVADTNVLSEPLRPAPEPLVLEWLNANAADIALTSVTVGELFYGVQRLPHGRRRERLQAAVEQLVTNAADRVLAFDDEAARHYARLRASRDDVGRPSSTEDLMIAATCVANGCALATRNTSDFESLGVELIDPWNCAG